MAQLETLEGDLRISVNIAAVFGKLRTAGRIEFVSAEDTEENTILHHVANLRVHKMREKTAVFL